MKAQRRRIPLAGCRNLRDLGGYVTRQQVCTKWNILYRSDLPLCEEKEWNYLYEELHVRCVIDLRSQAEQAFQPYLHKQEGIDYISIPLLQESFSYQHHEEAAGLSLKESIARNYVDIVLSYPEGITAVLIAVARNLPKGAVLFHCTSGKDRTGIVAFFLLWLVQTMPEDIMADYQISSTYLYYGNSSIDTLVKELQSYDTSWMHTQPEALGALLAYFTAHDMEAFLQEHGMEKAYISYLKEYLIE